MSQISDFQGQFSKNLAICNANQDFRKGTTLLGQIPLIPLFVFLEAQYSLNLCQIFVGPFYNNGWSVFDQWLKMLSNLNVRPESQILNVLYPSSFSQSDIHQFHNIQIGKKVND